MRQKPRWFYILSATLVFIAVGFPAQVMLIYGHGFSEWSAVAEKLTTLNWLVMAACLYSSILVWQASPQLKLFMPLIIVLMALNNYCVGYYATDYSLWTASWATCGFVLLNAPLLHPNLQWVLFHPEMRWWMRSERKTLHLPVLVEGTRLASARTHTYDISMSGAFVPGIQGVSIGDWITLRMKFGSFTQIRCQAKVVRRSESAGTYPAGVGVQFMNMSRSEKRELNRCLSKPREQWL